MTLLIPKDMHIKSQEGIPLAHFGSSEHPLANHFDQTDGVLFLEMTYSLLWPGRRAMVLISNSSITGGGRCASPPSWKVVLLGGERNPGQAKKEETTL